MTLAPAEFIRRFLLHVLPDGFQNSPASVSFCLLLRNSRSFPRPHRRSNRNTPRHPRLTRNGSRPVLSVAARWRSLRRSPKRIAIAFPGSTLHEHQRVQQCNACSAASGASMRSGSLCVSHPFLTRLSPLAGTFRSTKEYSALPTCPPISHMPGCEGQRPLS